ncbi:MAG: hypothetical protein JSW63_03440 [Ignavibacterium sp.]|nr:MAG: hypothetical protein JSW63_03440 [Ignavibacterium sp.]
MKVLSKIFGLTILIPISLNVPLATQTNNHMEKINNNKDLFIYHLKLTTEYNNPANWTDATYKVIQEHSEFIDSLGGNGILIFAGRTELKPGDDNLFGIAVIKASSLETAKDIMASDPAVLNKIQKASIFPFSLGIRYFENLESATQNK